MMGSVQPPTTAMARPGVLTKTVVRTPVIKFILHARIRHQDLNDVVFVGEDFIHIKQVIDHGHLKHIATKDNFDAHITAAKTFSLDHDPSDKGEDFIKKEQANSQPGSANSNLPPQFVVLTLDSDDLVFLYLKHQGDGTFSFIHQACPMPRFDDPIHQLGSHLAVDPASRAIAVAASEKEVIIYSAKSTDLIRRELKTDHPDWYPVTSERAHSVTGVIQHLEFLHPPDNDPDHIILLLILVDNRRTKAVRIEWYGTTDLRHAQVHPPQPMEATKSASNLLIPLRDAAFLMITGSEMKLHKNILSGSMSTLALDPDVGETKSPGSSPRRPIWTSWCRPLRNQSVKHGQDIVYLVREDGIVIQVEITSIDTVHASHAGDIGCHVGSAFASLGDPSDPDILAVVGDMSTGRVVHMGNWPSPSPIAHMSRIDAMEMQDSETLPNWASSIDMVVSKLPQSHSRSPRTRDAIILTSGREPYGTVTELRKGLEARVGTSLEFEALKGATGAWVLPNSSTGSILMLLSTPSFTRIFDFAPDLEEVEELGEDSTTVMVLDQRTLTAAILDNGHLVQISEGSISTSANLYANFEDRSRWHAGDGMSIIAAAIEPSQNCVVAVRRGGGVSELLAFRHHAQSADQDSDDALDGLQQLPGSVKLPEEPLCLTTTLYRGRLVGLLATVEGNLELFTLNADATSPLSLMDSMQIIEDKQSLCDNIVLLRPISSHSTSPREILAVCGLRDGSIVSVSIGATAEGLEFGESHRIQFGHETVRLIQQANEIDKAYAFCGLDTCVLTWDGTTPQSLDVKSLCVSDRERPQLAQGAITTISMMPSSEHLSTGDVGSHAGFLVIVSSSEVLFAVVDDNPTVIPRQVQVTGTPNRVIYAEQHRNLVCASVCTGVRSFPSERRNAPPEEHRQIWPVIEFIPADRDSVSFTFDLQPGEKVYALLEWSFQQKGKTYSFIMVGGSFIKQSTPKPKEKGRIAFLQMSSNRQWEVENVKEARSTTFDDPVYALALYDEMTYVACTGDRVLLSRFDAEERKWENICAPLKLADKSTSVSVSGTLIHLSTAGEGLITLRLDHLPSRDENGKYPYRLTIVAQPPRADRPLDHTVLSLTPDTNFALVATKTRSLLGLTSPPPNSPDPHRTHLRFEANLPRSLVRITQGSTRPFWRSTPPPGVLASNIIGLSTDGSITGIAILDEPLWRRLFWLQRVLEWDKHFSPHAPGIPVYGTDVESSGSFSGRARGVPVGFAVGSKDEFALFVDGDVNRENDGHIDGDVLGRVLVVGGEERLMRALRGLAERDDVVGTWVGGHLEEEIEAVKGIVGEVRTLVGMWL